MNLFISLVVVFTGVLWMSHCQGPKPDVKKDTKAGYSYALGVQIAQQWKKQGVDVDVQAFYLGFSDVFQNEKLRLTDEEMSQKLLSLQEDLARKMEQEAQKNLKEGETFLEKNRNQPGVITLASGVQLKFIQKGNGPIPQSSDVITVNYRGRLINGQVFDSSYSRNQPAQLPMQGLIPGLVQALQEIPVGSKVEVYIPPHLAYGASPRPGIPPNSVLIFDLELLSIANKEGAQTNNSQVKGKGSEKGN